MAMLNDIFHERAEHLFAFNFNEVDRALSAGVLSEVPEAEYGARMDPIPAIDRHEFATHSLYPDAVTT